MKSLKITIKPQSSLASPLMSDTLFGHFCWQYLELYGEAQLEKCLKNYPTSPFIVFSDGFPSGHLPKPLLKPEMHDPETDIKQYKKRRYLKKDLIQSQLSNLKEGPLFKAIARDKNSEKSFSIRQRIFKNAINRITNTAEHLYHTEEDFFEKDFCFDIYLKYDERQISLKEIRNVLEHMGQIGYGKDVSTGKGRFSIQDYKENPKILDPLPNANAFISLSHGLPDPDITTGYYKTITKFPKHGGHLAINANPFKCPIILLIPGSVFFIKKIKPVYGTAVNISPNQGNHLHTGFMIPVFSRIEGV